MFEKTNTNEFLNRAHLGQYEKIQFDTYVDDRGKEEIEDVEATLHYVKKGEGTPLILLHGLGQSLFAFRENINGLSQHFCVYAIDLPAHGFSDKPHISYSTEEISLCLESFMNAQEIESAHFCAIGESVIYVLDFALHNRDRVGNIISISPTINTATQRIAPIFPLASQAGGLLFNKSGFDKLLTSLYFDMTVVTDTVLDEYFQPYASKDFRQILKIYMQNFNFAEPLEQLLELDNHILVIRGSEDNATPPLMDGIAALPAKDLRTFAIKNCGYLAAEEKSDKVNEAIVEFCKIK